MFVTFFSKCKVFWTEVVKTSKTTFNNDQPRSGKVKDLWLETLFRDYSWDIETHCYEKPSKSAQIAIAQVVK